MQYPRVPDHSTPEKRSRYSGKLRIPDNPSRQEDFTWCCSMECVTVNHCPYCGAEVSLPIAFIYCEKCGKYFRIQEVNLEQDD